MSVVKLVLFGTLVLALFGCAVASYFLSDGGLLGLMVFLLSMLALVVTIALFRIQWVEDARAKAIIAAAAHGMLGGL